MRLTEQTLRHLEKKVLEATGGYIEVIALQNSSGIYTYDDKEYKTLEELKESVSHFSSAVSVMEVAGESIKRYSEFTRSRKNGKI